MKVAIRMYVWDESMMVNTFTTKLASNFGFKDKLETYFALIEAERVLYSLYIASYVATLATYLIL